MPQIFIQKEILRSKVTNAKLTYGDNLKVAQKWIGKISGLTQHHSTAYTTKLRNFIAIKDEKEHLQNALIY